MRVAYSYIRFSTPDQKRGDSKRRQTAQSERYAKEHNLVLDTSLKLYDEGKSAFRGKHRSEGALKSFLDAVESGRVRPGSVLLVENLDRLSREKITTALAMFMAIIGAGIEIVTLRDGQRYSQQSVDDGPGQLMLSLCIMWRAHEESALKAWRLAQAWDAKRQRATNLKLPMSSICPGWLRLKDKTFEVIPERGKLVRLIFWLTARGWGKRRIVRLFNKNKVPTWGVGKKQASGWHESYIQKTLGNRAVLGEFTPHSRHGEGDDLKRKPVGEAIPNYYPRIISDLAFQRAQRRAHGPRGPVGKQVSNLFQGLLRDGEHPEITMCYRDHGGEDGNWCYLVSDIRRVEPGTPLFSWNYQRFEQLVLNYLQGLDWSSLAAEKTAEVQAVADRKVQLESELAALGEKIKRHLKLAESAGDEIPELAKELKDASRKKRELQAEIASLTVFIDQQEEASPPEMLKLVKSLAGSSRYEDRLRLRDEIRRHVERIELYRKIPQELVPKDLPKVKGFSLVDLLAGRCVRIKFLSGAERWVADQNPDGIGININRHTQTKNVIQVRDEAGAKVLDDERLNKKLPPTKRDIWRRKQKLKD